MLFLQVQAGSARSFLQNKKLYYLLADKSWSKLKQEKQSAMVADDDDDDLPLINFIEGRGTHHFITLHYIIIIHSHHSERR